MIPEGNADGRPAGRAGPRPAGQGVVEYGVMLILTALLIAIVLVFFGNQVATILGWLSSQIP